jgi:CheY-like chemotaxis protein
MYVLCNVVIMTAKQAGTTDGTHRILVVEDDSELAGMLDYYLRGHGYHVTCVSNGVDALRAVMENNYNAILCDMVMPRMPGDMFYMAVRRVRPHLCDRFIFVTAHQENARVKEFLNQMPELVLRKPFHLDDLLMMLLRVFAAQVAKANPSHRVRTENQDAASVRRPVATDAATPKTSL